jgi:uncharacterized lipoprotein YddW (UPF0748 family)
MSRIIRLSVLILLLAASRAAPDEVRAIWITRWDYRSEEDVRRAVRWSSLLGLNRVFFQVRGRADAFYRSSIEPWGEELGGHDPGFDPLAVAIDEARKVGIELDAWINVLPAWKGARAPASAAHVLHTHPDWFLVDRQGRRHVLNPSDYTILNPCLPEVRAYIVGIVKDIASRYAIDGIQLDYIRFVGRDADHQLDFPYDPRTLRLFRRYANTSPFDDPAAWDRWRALSVDTLVYRISEAVRTTRPGARVTVAAIQDYERARRDLFQDVVKWQANGWIDEVYPMTYHRDDAAFRLYAGKAIGAGAPGKVIPGIGVHLLDSVQALARQIEWTRSSRSGGYCLFAYSNFFPSTSHESRSDTASRLLRTQMRSRMRELNSPGEAPRKAQALPANVPRT